MKELPIFKDKEALQTAIDEVKNSLTSLTLDYQAIDYFVKNCRHQVCCHKQMRTNRRLDMHYFGWQNAIVKFI